MKKHMLRNWALLNRFGQSRGIIAEATLWSALDASPSITATTIHADAGNTSRSS